ncbi:UNVERIFIED_CONTAM: hypothetical protein Sindi_0501100 [Sesamum indicum]
MNKDLEEKMNSEISQAMKVGKEEGFSAGHAAGKIADYLIQGFERCKAQVATLSGFAPDFDTSKLDPDLDGDLQPFPDKDIPQAEKEDEFVALLDEIED